MQNLSNGSTEWILITQTICCSSNGLNIEEISSEPSHLSFVKYIIYVESYICFVINLGRRTYFVLFKGN